VTARGPSGQTNDRSTGGSPWRAPTRRAFVAMISAAAAALAAPNRARLLLGPAASGDEPPRHSTKTLWIGHC
jgi:hypothetical protein